MIVAQISDTHIKPSGALAYGVVDTAVSLRRAVAKLNRLDPQPDLIIATGDLVDAGRPAEYDLLRELVAPLRAPLYLLPGNHDDRDNLRASFPGHAYLRQGGESIDYVVDAADTRLIALDSTIPGEEGGALREGQLGWLEARLRERSGAATIIALHHPPFRSGIAHMDGRGLANAERFAAILAGAPNVARVACGHLHRTISARFGGTIAMTAPSTAHQIMLDLNPAAPLHFALEPPAFLLHVRLEGAPFVTHIVLVGDFPGPYPFHEGGRLIE